MKKTMYILLLSFLVSCSGNYIVRLETPSQWYSRNKQEVQVIDTNTEKEENLPNIEDKLKEIKKDKEEIDKKIVNLKKTEVYGKDNFFTGKATQHKDERDNTEKSIISIDSPNIPNNINVSVVEPKEKPNIQYVKPVEVVKPIEVVKVVEVVKPVEVYVPNLDNNIPKKEEKKVEANMNNTVVNPVNQVAKVVEPKPVEAIVKPRPDRHYNVAEQKLIKYITDKVLENKEQVEDLIEKYYERINNKLSREIFIALCAKYIRDQRVNNFAYGINQVVSEIESEK